MAQSLRFPGIQILHGACPLDCPDACSLDVQVENGRVVKVDGNRVNPYTLGYICSKVRRFPELLYGEGRLLYPAVRRGAKGGGRFERISWDEALDLAAETMRRPGSASAASRSCRSPMAARTACSPRTRRMRGCSTGSAPHGWPARSAPFPRGRRRAASTAR